MSAAAEPTARKVAVTEAAVATTTGVDAAGVVMTAAETVATAGADNNQ